MSASAAAKSFSAALKKNAIAAGASASGERVLQTEEVPVDVGHRRLD